MAVLRHHVNPGVVKYLMVKSPDNQILGDIAAVTVDGLDMEMARTLAQIGRFRIKDEAESLNPQEPLPVTIIASRSKVILRMTLMQEFDECISLMVYDNRRTTEGLVKSEDVMSQS